MDSRWLGFLLLLMGVSCEHVRDLEVSEGAPTGTRIGFIGDGASDSGPPYLIVADFGSIVDTDLSIDQTTGEIRTKVPLDRETRASYSLVAIPISGDNVRVVVKVLDENDNAPTFPTSVMNIEFPENTPRDVKRTLHPARDADLGIYNTQKYNIVSGNVNGAFRLSSHRERDGVLYLDLQINGFLDRETTPYYSLVIEALDGGSPPLRGEMTVNITIQDVNDNQPVFNQTRYFASVQENATVGTSVLQVFATDSDIGENGQVEYSINRRQSDKDNIFRIDASTGVISVNKPLDYEVKEMHEIVVVARDHGLQPLETTTFVSIKVTDVNDNQPIINVIFLSDDATPKISESAQPGEFVARISVHDPDSKTEYSNMNVTLNGGEGHFGLTTRDNIIYLMIVSLPLDRESQPNYTLSVIATDTGKPPLHASKTINLMVTDINDNAPEFEQKIYYANVMEVSDPGTSVIQVIAHDKDEGNNSAISYSLEENQENHSSWFQIDSKSGLVTTRAHVDCETDPVPILMVVATDSGFPPLSSTAIVNVTIHDVNDNEPIFDQSFYNVSVAENERIGRCILKVSATDPDCGINAMVNYTFGDGFGKLKQFEIRPTTGEVCITSELDYETRNVYEFPIIATDRGGLSTTAMVKIQITDVNDNFPVFYPREYNVSLREGGVSSSATTPVVVVAATDADSGRFGTVNYRIVAGNDAGLFRIDRNTGEIFVSRPNMLLRRSQPYHHLNISASDGGNLKSENDAEVFISVTDSAQRPPIFEKPRYTFSIQEDVKENTIVGVVKAALMDSGGHRSIRYSIYSGDPDGFFRIDPVSGSIRTARNLEHESRASVLLNIQATSGDPPAYGHAQVNVDILDVNDNAPEFESNTVRISVPENVEVGVPLYAANARDNDSGLNGAVQYRLVNTGSSAGLFAIDPKSGHITITRSLDYESTQRHNLIVTATDKGVPPLSSNLSIIVEVQDVNDNPPVFEQKEYTAKISESLPISSQILQVTAIDLDTGNNARLTYRLASTNNSNRFSNSVDIFGIFPNSGWIYLRNNLDREQKENYDLIVAATDNGTPSQTATAKVTVKVLDANDNDPVFLSDSYEFSVEENQRRGAFVGVVSATDADIGLNAALRYNLIPGNTSFQISPTTGEITTISSLDREFKEFYDLVAEARDQGTPSRSSRVVLKIKVLDVNDNAPEIVDPQEDVVSVREEQPPNTEVVKVKAIDPDNGNNASIIYSLVNNRESDGYGIFTIDQLTGVIRTRMVLDHEEKTIYRIDIAASDNGNPPKQTIRMLRVEVLDLNDNRPTFTSSSLVFQVKEDVRIGFIVGSVAPSESLESENVIPESSGGHVMYTLNSLTSDQTDAFDIDRSTGSLIVAKQLDREVQSEYKLEVRALDTSAINNPQSSAVTVRVEITDVNDNAPEWSQDPVTIQIAENSEVGLPFYNLSASDADSGSNGEIRYSLLQQTPEGHTFNVDPLTGTLTLMETLDYENVSEYVLIVEATDQSPNLPERLSTSVTVRIIVTDSNDNSPKFVIPTTSNIFISDSAIVGMAITRIIAVDRDHGDNGRVTYVITNGNEQRQFSLGYDNGILTLAKPISSAMASNTYTLNITASDHGTPTRQTFIVLNLSVRDSNDNPPRFHNAIYYANVPEEASSGTFVIKVSANSSMGEGKYLQYFIPPGIANDAFIIDSSSGIITTKNALDREETETYNIPVYVLDVGERNMISPKSQFDVTTVSVTVTDINDHAPAFRQGSCYPLAIPENNKPSVVHTVVANDLDSGKNAEVIYAITGGNVGNMFSIDPKTGQLKARSLDRESNPRFKLTITAQDRGNPPLSGFCNISVFLEDQNDNDPIFDKSNYMATILEDVPPDTSVLKVHATDADIDLNGRIIYSLANENQSLFRIDNKTGIITTTGFFDRERQQEYNFLVVATDSGKYDARSQRVAIKVLIGDVNDNKPIFVRYPFKEKVSAYIQPGQTILKVSANDLDQGTNSEIVYNLANDNNFGKFRMNPNTGVLTATQSLASENGRTLYINVIATDKGNPPQSSNGLIEINVGDIPDGFPKLRFQNSSYVVVLPENANQFRDVIQISAVRTDGRKQKIFYSFGNGNELNTFVINSESGIIQVRDSKHLDYEQRKEIKLVVEARTDGNPSLHGYCDVIVKLTDQNDNAPTFTQQEYTASVWEGNNKSAYVLQVVAFDADEDRNSKVLYHIVDGNLDNAFKIEPAFSGILKTNIVLDREIRDTYRLTVIATDQGVPQMTGTARIRINVVDVNDNKPTFPPHSIITVSEATEVGTVLTTLTANDVDSFPPLMYDFSRQNEDEIREIFDIDRFSGKLVLKKPLDYEVRQEYILKITASDVDHTAETTLTIRITDVNDNAPKFLQDTYNAILPDSQSSDLIEILTINATDIDSGENARVKYTLLTPISGFSISEMDGILKVNQSNVSLSELNDYQITVIATDTGKPPLHSTASVKIKLNGGSGYEPTFQMKPYRIKVRENILKGSVVLQLLKTSHKTSGSGNLFISKGNDENVFEISNPTGTLALVKNLDREIQDTYNLEIKSMDTIGTNNSINVLVEVEDVNDNAPVFKQSDYEVNINEGTSINTSIMKVIATDSDLAGTPHSDIVYDITSGNDFGLFRLDPNSGILYVNKTLDYDSGTIEHNIVIRACDKGTPSLCTLNSFQIILEDDNDNPPQFPVTEYLEYVSENEPLGTAVFTARATDMDKGVFGNLNYSISTALSHADDSWKLFHIDAMSGLVTTNAVFDYEQKNRYIFTIKATDIGGKTASVRVRVEIESKDEFHPQFTERTYRFVLPTPPSGSLPAGYVVGHVTATDRDKGPDGRVVYQLTNQHPYFKMNRTTGAILVKRKIKNSDVLEEGKDVSLVITAGSGRQGSLTNMTVVEIVLDPLADPGILNENGATVPAANTGIADWALGLLIAFLLLLLIFGAVFVYLHMRNKRNKKVNKPGLGGEAVPSPNNYVDPSAFDTIPIRGGVVPGGNNNQFAPPKYDEIPPYGAPHAASSNSGAATTSELSGSDQSGSSGRGSAEEGEDGEDEEIRMINEGPLQRDSGIHRQNEDDNLSDVSVRNTQEYLARLGIVHNATTGVPQTAARNANTKDGIHHHQNVPLDGLRMFEEDGHGDNDITNLIYAKLNDVTGSDRASSSGEGAGVATTNLGGTMDHVMAIGGYGEVTGVTHQPSMNGSLSSIVHSEEELAGSYNWDYLLDWGPQYQPLAHVFSEIARLKDDTASVQSAASGNSSVKSKNSVAQVKSIPPPLITSVAPRAIALPVLNPRGGSSHHLSSAHSQVHMLPRSPINHDASGATFSSSAAMSPSFSPSLSPLATKSPSISPLVAPGMPNTHRVMPRPPPQSRSKTVVDTELRI
ncbi:protein dachsous [Agrilus planipennis]|uniref:Protein dachsous n=1 Tax=Agrilus planipennis TaxID=224129 RepID=A0A1W4WLJ5_AGRPL|nr:protein dachsous [Agrilus planipennis]